MRVLFITLFVIFASKAIAACDSLNARAFDFWVGNWQVSSPVDDVIRVNKISLINEGCTLLEQYSTPSGYIGTSLSMYDKNQKAWHQTWTDNQGFLLKLKGNISNGKMVMLGTTASERGKIILNRITWQRFKSDMVKQHWQTSKDHGLTWVTEFEGIYKKVSQ